MEGEHVLEMPQMKKHVTSRFVSSQLTADGNNGVGGANARKSVVGEGDQGLEAN